MNHIEIMKHTPIDLNGIHSFEIVVDDKPISDLLEDENEGIPWCLAGEVIPNLPLREKSSSRFILSVSGCGEYGCGSSSCEIKNNNETVAFENSRGDCGEDKLNLRLEFDLHEFEEQVLEMKQRAKKAHARIAKATGASE